MNIFLRIRAIKHLMYQLWNRYCIAFDRDSFGKIGPFSEVKSDSILVPQNIFIDDHVLIQNGINLIASKGRLIVKKYSVISSGCTLIPSAHKVTVGIPFYLTAKTHINDINLDIIINEDCWLGANCVVLPGCEIGRGAIVAAGAIVTKNVPPYAVVAGCPAKIIGSKFSREDIKKHEECIYPDGERMTDKELVMLFKKYFIDVKAIGTSSLSEQDNKLLRETRLKYGIETY